MAKHTGKTVLVVDRDSTVRSMVKYILLAESYTVHEASDCAQAHEKIRGAGRFDIVVIGINMEEEDCIALLRAVREGDMKNVPILMLSPEKTLYKQMDWKEAGATCWIIKPFTAEQFLKMVELVTF